MDRNRNQEIIALKHNLQPNLNLCTNQTCYHPFIKPEEEKNGYANSRLAPPIQN